MIIPAPANVKGNITGANEKLENASKLINAAPSTIVAIIDPTKDSKRSAPIPATSPTLSPTLSAIVAGFKG